MADKKQLETSKIDALYSWLSYDIQKMKAELVKEMKYSSVQMGSLYQALQADKDKSSQAISQEIRYSYKQNQTIYDGLATLLTREVGDRLNSMDATTSELNAKMDALLPNLMEQVDFASIKQALGDVSNSVEETVKYSFMQQQAIYDTLLENIQVAVAKVDEVDAKIALLDRFDAVLAEINARAAAIENADYQSLIESVAEKTEASVAEHTRQVLDAVENFTLPENVDYNRIVDEVGDKVLELLNEAGLNEAPAAPVEAAVDYDKIVYGTAEKVVESLPYPEKVNYALIENSVQKAVDTAVNSAVEKLVAAFNVDALADAVAAKLQAPQVDYDLLADMVAEKLAANTEQTFDVTLDEAGVDQIADKVTEKMGELDYDRIALIVEEKLNKQAENAVEPTYELVVDEEGVQAIAKSVSEEICQMCANCEEICDEVCEQPVEEVVEEAPAQEPVEEVVEETPAQEPVEEVVEEAPAQESVEEVVEETPAQEPVEEVVEEAPAQEPVEEVVEETPAQEPVAEPQAELAVAEEKLTFDELTDQLVDAETGLVIRLKKSFTAKLKQSEDNVKAYYSDLKNELVSYKKINSNISWHGDRFNFGRDTVAKVNICGKTLCFYLALDPENPDLKTTVYHQKNVGNQKAYENTPFMVKIKSDAAAKKALRLVGILAEKLGTEKEEAFAPVDYVAEFPYETTKQLFDAGYIKATKEKKVELDF